MALATKATAGQNRKARPANIIPANILPVVQGIEAPPLPPLLYPFPHPALNLVQVDEELLLLLVVQSVGMAHVAQRMLALEGGEHNLVLTAAGRDEGGGAEDGEWAQNDKGNNLVHTTIHPLTHLRECAR